VPLDPLQVARDAIKPPCKSGLQPIGAVGRQMRGERRFDDERLRHPLTIGVVGELAGEVRRQAEGVLRPHARSSSVTLSQSWHRSIACATAFSNSPKGIGLLSNR
jgi:hypothetical protein